MVCTYVFKYYSVIAICDMHARFFAKIKFICNKRNIILYGYNYKKINFLFLLW